MREAAVVRPSRPSGFLTSFLNLPPSSPRNLNSLILVTSLPFSSASLTVALASFTISMKVSSEIIFTLDTQSTRTFRV